ncbi:MAG: NAD-dependent epimerase/dehydratase family protein [bacterium]|nr:NAD-dependent epimerase/dehydratase family protein [Acidimicrobiia bacterium]MCY4650073.1 NAD-dependent epimerase/dehydratase family protein [bacterium]
MAARERFLVTGSAGCIGSWAMHLLSRDGVEVVGFDLATDHRRVRLLTDQQGSMRFVQGDITDTEVVLGVVAREGITHIVHLAALQIPFCQADPIGGARVNVVGTVNILESARRSDVAGLSYASSVAVYGPPDLYPDGVRDDSPLAPSTLYGAYKQANERSARVYAADYGVSSVCLRPCSVYGPGRDQGLTSAPTQAMVAAAAETPFHIPFGGGSTFQHAGEVARLFIEAARAEAEGAHVYNLGGPSVSIAEVVSLISAEAPGAQITSGDQALPLPDQYDGAGLDRLLGGVEYLSMEEGVATSISAFRELLSAGLIDPPV